VAGGVVGAAKPQSLPAKMLVGGVAGGGVGGGMKIAMNVAAGRPWNEDLGQAIAIGATTGMIDAFTDHYGDMLVERAMTPRPARGAGGVGDDADAWRRPGLADDADGLHRLPIDAERGTPVSDSDIDHPLRRFSDQDVVEGLRNRAAQLEETGRYPRLAQEASDLVRRIGAGKADIRILDDADYWKTTRKWNHEPIDPGEKATVNLETRDIFLRRSQIEVRPGDTLDDVIDRTVLRTFHENVHYLDYDNVTTLTRETWAYEHTAEFAEAVGLKYGALGEGDLATVGRKDLEGLVIKHYGLSQDLHQPSKQAAIRSGRQYEAVLVWFVKDKLPKLERMEAELAEEGIPYSLREHPGAAISNLRDPMLIWQYTRHVSGEDIPYDPALFGEMARDRGKLRDYLDSLPGWRYLREVPGERGGR
jgi:hypothetical protein